MSLYSVPQPLTRESTAYESEQVLTPTDIIPGQRFKGGAIGTGAPLIRRERSVLPSSDGYSFVDRLNAIREDGHYDPEPYGPYFSLPVDPAACTTLSRRTTTKDLISRYESLESTSSTRQEPPNAMAKKVKGRSPIRQSFRNLLSALGKRAKGMGKDHSASAASRSTVSICLDSPPLPSSANTRGIHLDIPSTNTSKSSSSGMPACITPTALHTGPLLYLCNPIAVGGLPIWVDCTAILHSSHIVVTWFTSHDNPSTTMITLPQCTDVRSLALADLDLDEKSMLPTRPNVGELKVFELLFEGRGREKFAAFSVTGRAGWVSAIWDAVLLCQDRKSFISSPVHTATTESPGLTTPSWTDAGTPYAKYDNRTTSPSVVASGYAGDASSGERSPSMFSNGTTSIARSTRESSLASPSEMQAESLLSSRSPRSSFHSRTRAAHTGSPGSPNTSIGFECRTDTSGLSPRPSLNSCSGPESPLHRESLTLSRASSRHESSVPALATPPLPSPQRFSLYDAPVSRSATATPTKFSLLATPTSTRSQSPSIMNLSQISMVKQRLAELERTKTLASQVASTPRSSRSRQYSPLPYSPQTPTSTRRSHGGTSLRVDTEGLSEKESIIDSYASSPRRGSPLSVFAGRSERLTSPLSRQSTIRTDTEKPANSHVPDALNSAPTFRDMCSPISAYSSDFPSPLPTPQHMPFGNIIDVVSEVQKSPSIPSRRCEGGSQEEHLDVGPARLIRSTHTIAPVERSPDPTQRFEDCARQSVTSRTPTPSQPRSSRIQSHPNSYESTPLPETVAIPERLTASAVPVRPVEHVCPRNQSSLRNGTRSPSRASTVQTGPREAEPTPKLQAPSPIQRTQSTIREQHVSSYMSAPPIRSSQIERSFPVSKSNDLPPTQRALPTVHQPHTRFPPPEPFPSTYNDQTPMNRASFSSSPKPPTPVQKTPLMLSLESPRGQHQPPISPLRGPPRPARLTKPQPLSPSTPSSQNFSAQADLPPLPPQNLVTPSPPPVTDQPVAALAVPTLAPAPAPSTHSDLPNKVVSDAPKSRGLFAALRRKGRRSSVEPPAPSVFANVAAPSPIVQVIKETIVERVPAPPIIQVDQETKQIMHSVEGAVNRVAEQEDRNGEQLSGIRSQVDTVLQELRQMPKPITPKIVQETPLPALPVPTPPVMDVTPITDRLDEMGTTLNINLPELLEKVEELMRQAEALQQAKSVVVLRNLPAIRGKSALGEDQLAEGGGSATDLAGEKKTDGEDVPDSVGGGAIVEDSEGSGEVQGTRLELFNPTQLEEKMDALLALCQQLQIERQNAIKAESSGKEELEQDDAEESARSDVVQRNAELQGILELLKNDLDLRAAQTDQQVDSVRYLHELNSWLEAFVNHGTSQIDQVLAGVNHLRKELGPLPDMQTMQDLSSSNNAGDSQQEHPSNLLSEIRHLLVASRNREGNTLALEASVNGLVAAVQEDLRRGAESRNAMTTESIVGLIERHRQDQERLLRNVASDLSNDIRGERLRFVEAMKEATAINVQIHVEEFKKELTREVLMATQEVGRLQKERQNLEQQIADLFSFYAKQKQSGGQQPQDPRPSLGPQRCSAPPPRVHNPKPLPSMRRRPLPSPSSRPPSAMR